MTEKELGVAERILLAVAEDAYTASIETEQVLLMDRRGNAPPEWRKAFNFLVTVGLLEVEGEWTDKTKANEQRVSLTALGIEAVNLGLRPYLKRRIEREEMRFRADRATARGYRINLWGIIFLVVGLVTSGLNLYIFYRQVFDPPLSAKSEQQQVEHPQHKPHEVQAESPRKQDTLAPTKPVGGIAHEKANK